MDSWHPEDDTDYYLRDDFEGDENVPVAFVATQDPIPLRVGPVTDDRTPDGMVCMGTFLRDHGQLIARSAVPSDVLSDLEESDAFGTPVRLAMAAVEEDPGIQCRLFALKTANHFNQEEQSEPKEPWAESVPSFEDLNEPDVPENAVVPLLLGHVVRFLRDRKHPEDLAREAGDVLRAILSDHPAPKEIVDKLLEDLLDELK